MKPPAGLAKPERRTRLSSVARPARRLDLRPARPPEDPEAPVRSSFWKWFGIIALVHVIAICSFFLFRPSPQPPEPFISLLPPGDIVHGSPGAQQAAKAAPTSSAAITPPQPRPAPATPAHQTPPTPKAALSKPAPSPVPKPTPTPLPSKVKVDLHEVERADDAAPGAATPKPHPKKVHHIAKAEAEQEQPPAAPDNAGLSREQVASELGKKLEAEGVEASHQVGPSGSTQGTVNRLAEFYGSIRDQVMNKWVTPNLTDETQQAPVVMIHVESDGRVPPELVSLKQSSGNAVYDQSAVEAARSIGYTLQPLPDGCPPDISINFKLNR